jgi:hypothetical protein
MASQQFPSPARPNNCQNWWSARIKVRVTKHRRNT